MRKIIISANMTEIPSGEGKCWKNTIFFFHSDWASDHHHPLCKKIERIMRKHPCTRDDGGGWFSVVRSVSSDHFCTLFWMPQWMVCRDRARNSHIQLWTWVETAHHWKCNAGDEVIKIVQGSRNCEGRQIRKLDVAVMIYKSETPLSERILCGGGRV